jgi:hypothetical protein
MVLGRSAKIVDSFPQVLPERKAAIHAAVQSSMRREKKNPTMRQGPEKSKEVR